MYINLNLLLEIYIVIVLSLNISKCWQYTYFFMRNITLEYIKYILYMHVCTYVYVCVSLYIMHVCIYIMKYFFTYFKLNIYYS